MRVDRMGWNVGPNVNKDRWYDLCRRASFNGALIISNWEATVESYNIIRARIPADQPVYITARHYYQGEESGWYPQDHETEAQYRSRLEAFRNGLYNLGHHPRIIHCLANEPALQDRDGRRLRDLMRYEVTMMNMLGEAGINFVTGHYPTGSWDAQDIRDGVYAEKYDTLHKWQERGLGFDSRHEYTPQFAQALFIPDWQPRDWLDFERWRPELWPDPTAIPLEDPFEIPDSRLRHHLLRRGDWFDAYCIRQYGHPLDTLITECAFDQITYVLANELLKDRYKPADMDFRGPPAYRKLWGEAFPYWSFDEVVYHQYHWVHKLYHSHIKSLYRFAMYQWQKEGCDHADLTGYHDMQIGSPHWHEPLSAAPQPPPPPEPPPIIVDPPAPQPQPEGSVWPLLLLIVAIIAIGVLTRA